MLYPLKFKTIFKEKIWGGQKIKTILDKDFSPLPNCGETWEISGIKDNISIVSNGDFLGSPLDVLIKLYKEKLVGASVYKKFKNEFPLLVKFIDANDDLSIQVHPNDELAQVRHNCNGKSEMWYIFQADENAKLNVGFNRDIDMETYIYHLENKSLDQILNFEKVNVGDVFYLPAGRVHYIGKGICLAEIQQSSDITYRIYDFDRKDDKGNTRELHTAFAVDAIDYKYYPNYKTHYQDIINQEVNLVDSPYFKVNKLTFDTQIEQNYSKLDSFVIIVCVEGSFDILYGNDDIVPIKIGECTLIPANLKLIKLLPRTKSTILITWIDED
jgi:mannose-6-phosphate isomerase